MSLTTEAFEKQRGCKINLQKSKQRIEALNKRSEELEEELFAKQEKSERNFRLLEGTKACLQCNAKIKKEGTDA